jgi:hypothetical protein
MSSWTARSPPGELIDLLTGMAAGLAERLRGQHTAQSLRGPG